MKFRKRTYYTEAQKALMWDRGNSTRHLIYADVGHLTLRLLLRADHACPFLHPLDR